MGLIRRDRGSEARCGVSVPELRSHRGALAGDVSSRFGSRLNPAVPRPGRADV
jgi:hypothetical protein